MPRPRREDIRQEIAQEIKDTARRQMSAKGTAGLSLRAIARAMGITAPAIYNYFPRLDDLITALIIDAFTALAEAMDKAVADCEAEPLQVQVRALMLAYRQWAIENPIQFQLIYGNPIPGYAAPSEITAPLARRPFETLFTLCMQMWGEDGLSLPDVYRTIPPGIAVHLETWQNENDYGGYVPPRIYYALMVGWSRMHGIVMLELFNHITPMIGDVAAFYEHEVDVIIEQLGMQPSRST